ncbi:MAG TPA: hypothetical protein VK203_25115 [Nostocaceae cyanobacterium]|nr:hypothetical protein [Nostocaceae cyanobacterium]
MKRINQSILLVSILLTTQVIATKTLAQEAQKDSVVPSQKEAIALMQNICGAGNINQNNGQVGCKVCPSFTAYNGQSGGSLTSVIYGSFTQAGTREALVDFSDCEPHAGNWGGTILLRRTNNSWSRIRYEQGVRSNICLKIPDSQGRHSLVCQGSYSGMGYLITYLDQFEIGSTKTKYNHLLRVESNSGTCQRPYYAMLMEDFKLQDTNKDGRADLVVKVSETREPKTNSTPTRNQCEDRPRLPKPTYHQLTFLSNGQSFRATPATAKLIKQLEP